MTLACHLSRIQIPHAVGENIMINKKFFKTKDEVEVTFEVTAEQIGSGKEVALVADFLEWQPVVMKKNAKSKTYKIKHRLPKEARFEFRYLVDSETWINDEAADLYEANSYGSDNSILSTYP